MPSATLTRKRVLSPILSLTIPDTINGPILLVPRMLVESDTFCQSNRPNRDRLAAYCHQTRACLQFDHLKKLRKAPTPTQKNKLNHLKSFNPAPVSNLWLSRLINPNALSDTFRQLVDAGIIVETKQACVGRNAAYLRFTDQAMESGFVCYRPETKGMIEKLQKPSIDGMIKEPKPVERELFARLCRMRIDHRAAIAEARREAQCPETPLTYMQQLQLHDSIITFATGQMWMIRDTFGERLHPPTANLRSAYRRFLRFDGQPLVNVDVANCQFLIMGLLAHRNRATGDTRKFLDLVESGQLYESVAADASREFGNWSRDKAKSLLMCWQFRNPKHRKSAEVAFVNDWIEGNYPAVAECVASLKTDDYTNCARQLQRLEREIMIDGAAAETLSLIAQDAFVGTIHDSLMVCPSDVEIATQAILNAFRKVGVNPTIRVDG